MTREQARDRFALTWGAGALTSVLGEAVDLPGAVRVAVGVPLVALVLHYGGTWLRLAVRDGSLRREVPDYGWAFLSLLLIAGFWALVAYPVLLVFGDRATATDVSSGAALGTFLTLVAWWVRGAITRG